MFRGLEWKNVQTQRTKPTTTTTTRFNRVRNKFEPPRTLSPPRIKCRSIISFGPQGVATIAQRVFELLHIYYDCRLSNPLCVRLYKSFRRTIDGTHSDSIGLNVEAISSGRLPLLSSTASHSSITSMRYGGRISADGLQQRGIPTEW